MVGQLEHLIRKVPHLPLVEEEEVPVPVPVLVRVMDPFILLCDLNYPLMPDSAAWHPVCQVEGEDGSESEPDQACALYFALWHC